MYAPSALHSRPPLPSSLTTTLRETDPRRQASSPVYPFRTE